MNAGINWRRVWEDSSKEDVQDFKLDHGISPRGQAIESLSERELVDFIEPKQHETLLDAGCGTGANILNLHSRVRNIIGIDFAQGSVERCQKKIDAKRVGNAQVYLGAVTALPLPDRSVDKIICLSVLQYLDDDEVRQALKEFMRVSLPGGIVVLHVKNSLSPYWMTLRMAKKLKRLLGRPTAVYHLRSFRWYLNELAALNCRVVDYNSFNLLTIDGLPTRLTHVLQGTELKRRNRWPFRTALARRCGADLKIKAVVGGGL